MNIHDAYCYLATRDPLSIWGAAISTILAGIKIWEVYKSRLRIEIARNLTSDQEMGNDIIIRNLSSIPITVTNWELQWVSRKLFVFRKITNTQTPNDICDLTIPPHSNSTINFSDENYFPWGKESVHIYLKLWVAGKRSKVIERIYP